MHKIIQINNLKLPLLLCVLPDGALNPSIIYNNRLDYFTRDKWGYPVRRILDIPPGDWEPLGWLNELKEEQLGALVESWERFFPERHICYMNYNEPIEDKGHLFKKVEQKWSAPFGNAKEAFYSALEASGYYWKNPYHEPTEEDYLTDLPKMKAKWRAAQERVLDRWRCFVIVNKEK